MTGIGQVETATDADAPCYDLAGRRVANPGKGVYGLYISGNKKVIIR